MDSQLVSQYRGLYSSMALEHQSRAERSLDSLRSSLDLAQRRAATVRKDYHEKADVESLGAALQDALAAYQVALQQVQQRDAAQVVVDTLDKVGR